MVVDDLLEGNQVEVGWRRSDRLRRQRVVVAEALEGEAGVELGKVVGRPDLPRAELVPLAGAELRRVAAAETVERSLVVQRDRVQPLKGI